MGERRETEPWIAGCHIISHSKMWLALMHLHRSFAVVMPFPPPAFVGKIRWEVLGVCKVECVSEGKMPRMYAARMFQLLQTRSASYAARSVQRIHGYHSLQK